MRDGYRSDVVRQAANLVGAVFQILAAVAAGFAIGRISEEYETLVLPAGYAFAIWTPIFALSLVYAVYAAFPANREDPLLRRVGPFTATAFFLNGLWEVLFPARQLVAAQLVLFGVFLASGVAYLLVQRQISDVRANIPLSGRLLVAPTIGLLFGWVTAATLVGLATTLAALGVLDGGPVEAVVGGGLLILGGLIAAGALLAGRIGPTLGQLAYGVAVLWAFVAVVVEQYDASALTTGAAVVAVGLVALALFGARRGPPPARQRSQPVR